MLGGEPGYVYVLFEHKSYPDRLIALQVLEYMTKIWRLYLKQQAEERSAKKSPVRLPIILPLVLYHGKQKWPYGTRFVDLLSGPTEELSAYIPDFAMVLTDLTGYPDAEIKGTVLSRVVLLLFKHIFDPALRQELPGFMGMMRELAAQESGLRCIETLLRYICSATDTVTTEELLTMAEQAFDKQGSEIVMTIAEQLRKEGRREGRQEGRQEGKLISKILMMQGILGLTIYDENELDRKSLDELKRILTGMETQFPKFTEDKSGPPPAE